ncbi:hypothetical protein NP511_22580 (plasmid) [Natrinema thermotolerans]|uniref:Uncharacterized protein n=1 Tax=Natrinema thermotolerans TaxID=121872 RepID=A0AAF0T8H7_9EURY|nr:hypothetical protein [Natrinema thermotolerans]QCC57305.1 hypothetical protein DVR14_01095 [Natrinema thermotolerans]WMT10354.1 hypothetical protein NP511_22580 [Natrinema thermotolerans]
MMLIPANFVLQPLHNGEGNYYVGHNCPHCGEILYRSHSAGDEELADHAKEHAELDPDPPADLDELSKIEL